MRKWILRAVVALAILLVALGTAAWAAARHFQPYVRAVAIRYLEERFGTGVKLGSFRVSVSVGSLWKVETAVVRVSGDRLTLPYPRAPCRPWHPADTPHASRISLAPSDLRAGDPSRCAAYVRDIFVPGADSQTQR